MTARSNAHVNGDREKSRYQEIQALHEKCGVYTKPDVVKEILDAIGWRARSDLTEARLLEPAAGDGAFIAEAARRVVSSFLKRGRTPHARDLVPRISAFELHPREARRARKRVINVLLNLGIHRLTAESCARIWIANSDFLLAKLGTGAFTHSVGNPPYVRWSKIPQKLKARYNKRLPKYLTKGDLFLPFLDRALELLQANGRIGFLCSDRWRFMAFADDFREKWLPRLVVKSDHKVSTRTAFHAVVDSYPRILIASKTATAKTATVVRRRGTTLKELGYIIRVGPALGCTSAFVLQPGERDVEPQLLCPWIDGSEVREGKVSWGGRRVVTMHDSDGDLLSLRSYPRLKRRLERHREALKGRWIVRHGAEWFSPIDRVSAERWKRPKLLVPELARIPRIAIDRSGAIPSHGVYAIFAPDDDVDALYDKLRDGKLGRALASIAPRVSGNYVRCYRRFLLMIRI